MRSIVLGFVFGACCARAHANDEFTYCVGSSAELRAALEAAAQSEDDVYLRIKVGDYAPDAGEVAFDYFSTGGRGLKLEGGWVDSDEVPCSIQSFDARQTVLDGGGRRPVLRIAAAGAARISIYNLTIARGHAATDTAGLDIGAIASPAAEPGFTGRVDLDRIVIRDNHAENGVGGLRVATRGAFNLSNSLLTGNRCASGACAAELVVDDALHPGEDAIAWSRSGASAMAVMGNTVAGNACLPRASLPCAAGVRLRGSAMFAVLNNAFADNAGIDLEIRTGVRGAGAVGGAFVNHNRYDTIELGEAAQLHAEDNLVQVEPRFVAPRAGDYRLQPDSPLVDAGTHVVGEKAYDIAGWPRRSHSARDIGAYGD
jgi:hypothetical protein